jgi:phosphatidylinositol alpha-1,6-mannosyltransferase
VFLLFSHLAIARAQAFIPAMIRRPYAIFLHGIEAWRPLTRAQQRALQGASALLVNSAYTAKRVRTAHPWMSAPLVCPLTLETPAAPLPEVSSDRRWGRNAVLLVGRMAATERYKGHDELLDAWPRVRAAVPDARLVFVGEGDDRDRLRERAEALGVATSLVMTGFLDHAGLDDAYGSAAVFAMPSRNEGFGLVYLEAMARGLPCVGSVFDAAAEVIDDGVTGFLVDQSDTRALAERVIVLLRDRELRRTMGTEGHRRACGTFGYAQFRDRVVSAVSGALAQPLAASALASRSD